MDIHKEDIAEDQSETTQPQETHGEIGKEMPLVRGSPSQVKGVGFRSLSCRGSWVRIPPPAPL